MPAKTFAGYFVVLLCINLIFIAPAFAQNGVVPFNEKFVIAALEKFTTAEIAYFHNPDNDFHFGDLNQLRDAGLIDDALAYGEKYGYQFSLAINPPGSQFSAFQIWAIPHYYGKGGRRSFYLDTSGVIRGADRSGAPATGADPIIPPTPCDEDRIIPLMRNINSAEVRYFATAGQMSSFANIGNLRDFFLVDGYVGSGERCGYRFTTNITAPNILTGTPASYRAWATPLVYPVNGFRSYFTDQTGVVRGADKGGALAGRHDPPV